MGGMIHIKYFSKVSHWNTSLALFHHLTASKSFRKNEMGPRILPFAPKTQFESSPSQSSSFRIYVLFILYIMVLIKWLQSTDTAAALQLKSHERVCGVHRTNSHMHWHRVHAVLDKPPQERPGLLWLPGHTPVKFSPSSVPGFALHCGLKQIQTLGFSLSLFPRVGKRVHVCVHTNTSYKH